MASDLEYLNLLVWQALGSTLNHLVWCSILGLMLQCFLLGIVFSHCRRYLETYTLSDPAVTVLGVVIGIGLVMTNLGVTCSQTRRLISQSGDHSPMASADNTGNLIVVSLATAIGFAGMVYGIWKIWKLAGKSRVMFCGPLGVAALAYLGLSGAVLRHGVTKPETQLANLDSITVWINSQGNYYKAWAGLLFGVYFTIWLMTALLLFGQKRIFGTEGGLYKTLLWVISESMLPIIVASLVLLIQLTSHTPSLATSSRVTIQTLPALALLSILNPLIYRTRLQAIVDSRSLAETDLSNSIGLSRLSRGKRMTVSTFSFKNFSYKEKLKDEEEHSVRVTVDTHVMENNISPPPSAFSFNSRFRDISPLASPTPTLFPNGCSSPVFPKLASPFDPYEASVALEDDSRSFQNISAPSFKSAVPSGKSLAVSKIDRSKSIKSERTVKKKKKMGPVLDPSGWPDMPERKDKD
nr:hypothetical protein L203_02268 [Cryptococcus depauperatus CBS 7841]